MPGTPRPDPVFVNARREALGIIAIWLGAMLYCCLYSHTYGYNRPGRFLGAEDLRPVLGVPRWFLGGIIVPWLVCGVVSLLFVVRYMADDDLGDDHTVDLNADIRGEKAPAPGSDSRG